jgi:hypothetical protein
LAANGPLAAENMNVEPAESGQAFEPVNSKVLENYRFSVITLWFGGSVSKI